MIAHRSLARDVFSFSECRFEANRRRMVRIVTILAILQTLLVVLGFLALGAVLKVEGYPETLGVRWNPLAVWLREYGAWFLLVPILWVSLATAAQRRDRGFLSHRFACFPGVCIAVLTGGLFHYAAIFPHTRPIWMSLSSH